MSNIKDLREGLHMTQQELGKKSNVSRVSIARYESGERIPSIAVAARIAEALGCTVNDLVDQEGSA